jgi:hypothetical protein
MFSVIFVMEILIRRVLTGRNAMDGMETVVSFREVRSRAMVSFCFSSMRLYLPHMQFHVILFGDIHIYFSILYCKIYFTWALV